MELRESVTGVVVAGLGYKLSRGSDVCPELYPAKPSRATLEALEFK